MLYSIINLGFKGNLLVMKITAVVRPARASNHKPEVPKVQTRYLISVLARNNA